MLLPRQLTSSYHLLNYAWLLFFFAYVYPKVLRQQALRTPLGQARILSRGYTGLSHEEELIAATLLLFCSRLKKWFISGPDEILHRLLWHAKLLTLLATVLTGNYLLAVLMVGSYGILWKLVLPPRYSGPTKVTVLTPESYYHTVMNNFDPDVSYLVCFYDPQSVDCHYLEPIFHQLSFSLANQVCSLQFKSMDVREHVQMNGLLDHAGLTVGQQMLQTKHTPTIVLYYRGKEITRLPKSDKNGKVIFTRMNAVILCKHFGLNDFVVGGSKYRQDSSQKKRIGTDATKKLR